MQVRVSYFAALREAVGRDEETVEVPAGTSVGALAALLEARHGSLARHRAGLRFALGTRFAGPEEPLHPGCQVALLPPVSGG